jgi:gamma-glutamyltranspeptidase/glutathione hydrolase
MTWSWSWWHGTALAVATAAAVLCASCAGSGQPATPPAPWSRAFERGAVAADHAIASEAGAEMLRRGGNAVDAAVAASFALSVVRPFSCGIGGGGFMVIVLRSAEGAPARRVALNYREMAPAAVGPDFFQKDSDPDASKFGGKACAVPGTVAGLLYALERYGTLDPRAVLAPAIAAAEKGFTVDKAYAGAAKEIAANLAKHPEWKERFTFVWERFLRRGEVKAGDLIRLPEQAEALRLIARDGAEAFYRGPIARAIAASVARDGGPMTLQDLAGYRLVETSPLETSFLGRTVLTMPPPSSGGLAMAQLFGLLELLDVKRFAGEAEPPGAYVHLVTECFKHAFADRAAWLGDPQFVPGGVPVSRLTSDVYLRELAGRFDPSRTQAPGAYGSRPENAAPARDAGTSHLCAVDDRGNAVACTETINLEFGSLLAVDGFGFCLNNEMDDFTTRRGAANAFGLIQSERNLPQPGKRPLSSMSPTIVLGTDGRPALVAGASGGPRIITATTLTLLNAMLLRTDAGAAVQHGRFHHQWMPDKLLLEPALEGQSPALKGELEARGHVVETDRNRATVQLLLRVRNPNGWNAACDPRKGGIPAGW